MDSASASELLTSHMCGCRLESVKLCVCVCEYFLYCQLVTFGGNIAAAFQESMLLMQLLVEIQ